MVLESIMLMGTSSHVGKSILTTALCRIFYREGRRVVPFKAQNMALNSYVTKDGLEMGRAQVAQAEAAGLEPMVDMNPVLLKPTGNSRSQVILAGRSIGTMSAREYHAGYSLEAFGEVKAALARLQQDFDTLVVEGAGSPAEVNLKSHDIVNMRVAKYLHAPVLLIADIDRGGALASLVGTLELLDEEERALVKGLVINKFRGDVGILRPGLAMLEEKTQLPVLGVVPYLRVEIEDEDSLSDRLEAKSAVKPLDIAILRLPHVSNFTDFIPLEQHPLLGVRYVQRTRQLGAPDLVILPGTKNTMDDLRWRRESGLESAVLRLTPVLGVCGGYQMLGEQLCDPAGEESGTPCTLRGLGLLPTTTVFGTEKHLTQTAACVTTEPFAGAKLTGYEIHAGRTEVRGSAFCILADGTPEGCVQDGVFGTYLHGLFDTGELTEKLTAFLCKRKGIDPAGAELIPMEQYRQQQFDLLADGVRAALDMPAIYAAMGMQKGDNT